jgi:CDP-glycerol glycerophosphotransferase (TagB/SpsB family)
MNEALHAEFIQAHLDYVAQTPGVLLVIKKHPLEKGTLAEDLVDASGLNTRVKVFSARELSLIESFCVADLATAVCSTVLMEALDFGIQSASLDFHQLIRRLAYGYEKIVPLITQYDQVSDVFTDLLSSEAIVLQAPYHHLTQAVKETLFPVFEVPYEQRLKTLFQEAGWVNVEG